MGNAKGTSGQHQAQQGGSRVLASMSKSDSARIQSSQATGGHNTGQGTFAARAQAAGDRNAGGQEGRGGAKK